MYIDVNYEKRKKDYKIYLAKPNMQKISNLSESYGSVYSVKLGNINELNFNIPYFIDKRDHRVKNDNIELMKQKMYLEVDYNGNQEWMIIDEMEDFGDGKEKYLSITAFSNVYENSHKMIRSLNLDSVNPNEYYNSVLADTAWSIGEIDPVFKDVYRSFEISESTVLESILTGAETYGAVLDFDSHNKVINLIDVESRAKYRGLNINYKNFLQSVSRKSSSDEMTTRMYVYGADGMTITNVNPTGMPYIEDFSYFLYPFERDVDKNVLRSSNYMSDELAHAILDLQELNELHQPTIEKSQKIIDGEIVKLVEAQTTLSNLEFDLSTVKGLLDIAKATGDTELINQRKSELIGAQSAFGSQKNTVDNIKATIEYHEGEISRLQKLISVTSFSEKLLDELNPFIIEKDFSDDRYINEEELYQDAVKKFEEFRSPTYIVNASIDNIINSLEEEYYSDKVVLGDIARIIDSDMSVDTKSLITEMTFNMDENSHDITISEGDIEVDGYDRILSILYDTQSTTTQLANNKHKWDAVTQVKNEVDIMRESSIDATKNRIYAGINESIKIGDRGIILSNPDFPDEMVIMQAGVIALSKDGGETWNTSITPDGVVADTIVGKLVASNNLIITNDKGSFRVDNEGLTVDMDSIKIMSGEGSTPQNMIDSWNAILVTMDEFANDDLLNPYEKAQIKKQWESIEKSHSSMVSVFIDGMGPETPDNPYPLEYKNYMVAYEKLNDYLNNEVQSDGHTILDPNNMENTTNIDSVKYKSVIDDYQVKKDRFQEIIPLEFSQTYIEQLKDSISLNYVKNGEVISSLELYEDGTKIDGKFLDITAQTNFNDDVVMNAGVIRSKDNGISIDLNAGTMNLSRPLTINYKPVATKEDIENIELKPGPSGKTAYEIAVENGFAGTEAEWIESLVGTKGPSGKTAYEVAVEEGFQGTKSEWLNSLKGPKGDVGVSITKVDVEYAQNTSATSAPTSGWSTNAPTWKDGQYIWSRTKTTYSIGNPTYSKPACITGQKGPEGGDGNDGKGISSIVEQYYLSDSKETRTGGSWTTTVPKWEQGKYMWTRSQINWINPADTTYTDPIVDTAWEAMQEGTKGIGLADKTEALLGTEIYTDKADDSVVHLEIDGKSYQHAGSGKNLLVGAESYDWGIYADGYSDVTVNNKGEYIIRAERDKVTGSFGVLQDGTNGRMNLESGKRYTLSFDVRGNIDELNDIYISNYENRDEFSSSSWQDLPVISIPETNTFNRVSVEFTKDDHTTEYGSITICTVLDNGDWFEVKNIQIEEGTTATPYEPPAPTPDYPIEIHSLNDFDVVSQKSEGGTIDGIEVGGRNYFSQKNYSHHSNEGYRASSWTSAVVKAEPNTEYTISYTVTESNRFGVVHDPLSNGIHADYTDPITLVGFIPTSQGDEISVTVKTPNREGYLVLYLSNQRNDIKEPYLMVGKGNIATDWTPAPEDITEDVNHPLIDKISLLLSEPLRSVGDAKDRLFRDTDGLWKIERNVGIINNITGYDSFSVSGASTGRPDLNRFNASTSLGAVAGYGNAISSHVPSHTNKSFGAVIEESVNVHPSTGQVTLFLDSDRASTVTELRNWMSNNNVEIQYIVDPRIETLDQVLQDKLNNLRSFQDSNYVYTIINDKTDIISENLKPTLHATFKGGGWYSRWKTEDELERQQKEIDEKTDGIEKKLGDFVTVEDNSEALGEITTSLNDYLGLVEQTSNAVNGLVDEDGNLILDEEGEPIQSGIATEMEKLLDKAVGIENNLGEFTESWNFDVSQITMGEEGLFVGNDGSDMGILIAPDRIVNGETIPAGIYFMDGGETIAFISGQMMQINRGIFVDSAQIGEHQIETISGGHTIFRWIPK